MQNFTTWHHLTASNRRGVPWWTSISYW